MVAHESQLYPNLTIYENLLFAARMSAVAHARRQVEQWLERVGLTPYAQCLPCQISHGMRRRVSVARGVLHQPSVVLLDEPFSGLDSEGQDWLAELLADLQRTNQSICFTTHDTNHAQLCADQVFVLQSGKLQPVSDVPNLTNKHSLSHQPAA
jgi:ABC-type multidrug transport system ATPase subunit